MVKLRFINSSGYTFFFCGQSSGQEQLMKVPLSKQTNGFDRLFCF